MSGNGQPLVTQNDRDRDVLAKFLRAAVAGQFAHATALLEEELARTSLPRLYADVITPALNELGSEDETRRPEACLMASVVVSFVLTDIYRRLVQPRTASKGIFAMVIPEGECHTIGPRMVADVLATDGWRVQWNSPSAAEKQVKNLAKTLPSIIGISSTAEQSLPAAKQLIMALRSEGKLRGTPVIVGGKSFQHVNRFSFGSNVRVVGVDMLLGLDMIKRLAALTSKENEHEAER